MSTYSENDDAPFVFGAFASGARAAQTRTDVEHPGAPQVQPEEKSAGDRPSWARSTVSPWVPETLSLLAESARRSIPGADGAGVTLQGPQGSSVARASAPFVDEIDQIQYELDQGPSIDAVRFCHTVQTGFLEQDSRWPDFVSKVSVLRVQSVMAHPINTDDGFVVVVSVYAHAREVFDGRAAELLEAFIRPASVALDVAHRAQPLTATTDRAVIERAIGVMMSRRGGTADRALQRLQRMSQNESRDLTTMAREIVNEALGNASVRYEQVRSPQRPYGSKALPTEPRRPLAHDRESKWEWMDTA